MRLAAKIAALTFLVSAPAAAQVGTFRFVSGSNVAKWGVSVGTYKGILDGRSVDIFCVDFVNHISAGNVFQVNITSLATGSNLSKTRFGTRPNQPNVYRQTAWLASQFSKTPTSEWGYIHAAIWNLTSGFGSNLTGTNQAKLNSWLALSAANYGKYTYDNVYLLTDVALGACQQRLPNGAPWNGCGKQEQIFLDGGLTPVPEPATIGLLAMGLVAMGGAGVLRRRRKP